MIGSPDSRPPPLRLLDISKSFGGTRALDAVSFDLTRGEVHALLGGNGSGKSTTIKVLAGVYEADAGELELRGERIDARAMTPVRAREAGLRFVHQQQSTFPDLTVAENLAVGHGFPTARPGRIRWRAVRRRTRQVLERFGIDADPDAQLAELNPASRAMVAIARALQDQDGAKEGVLVLDEPTASLPASEVALLLSALRSYAAAGQTILYVTHRLEEVLEVADRATILRDGRVAATVERSEINHEALVELIMGRRVEQALSLPHDPHRGAVAARADELTGGAIRGATFSVHAGEIVGLAGLVGSGRSTLLRMIFGRAPIESGDLEVAGERVRFSNPRQALRARVAYVPEDRLGDAAFADLTLVENLGMTVTGSYFQHGRLRHRRERHDARQVAQTYQIKSSSIDAPFASMSGGNQQKAILARWMRRDPRLLLLDEPTQGVDVGARAEIWQLVRRAVDSGAAALVASSDFEELARVCDRVLVLRGGRIAAALSGRELTGADIDRLTLSAEVVR